MFPVYAAVCGFNHTIERFLQAVRIWSFRDIALQK